MPAFHVFRRDINQCMLVDRNGLRKRLQSLEHDLKRGTDEENEKYRRKVELLAADIRKSKEQVSQRRKSVPRITYDADLPVVARKDEIADLIKKNQVVVICGETGSGKSTQIPKICLEIGRGVNGMIGHTQPRRIAARSVAARIADEVGTTLGSTVGYKVRFADETTPTTLVKLMTDGILLAESQTDRFFDKYDTIIIDEAHERSLNIDFLLGMMKRLLIKRRDLKLIITSATIDAQRFAEHFGTTGGPAPIIEVSGRNYPIEILYRPVDEYFDTDENKNTGNNKNGSEKNKGNEEPDEEKALLAAVDELAMRDRGDILIFMPTERDIFDTAKSLRNHKIPGDDSARQTEILPLYARLPIAQQQKIFKKHSYRRIVITTNVAESSLTVPGVKYVIDTGTARISRYSPRSKTQRLPIEAVSQASANQRAGRCGRVGPGVCIRLYSKEDYDTRERYTIPEIQRTNLASVILQTKALKLGAIESFPFLDPPRFSSIQDGYKTLFELGATDTNGELTDIGWKLSKLPVDPRIARMILAADKENCLREMLIIASVLEIQDPRERPHELHEKADAAHEKFIDPNSDFASHLKMWDFFHGLKDTLSRSQLRKAASQNFLSFNRMKEWSDIHLQLLSLIRDTKMQLTPRRDDYDAIHRSILTGMLSGIACRDEKNEYLTAGPGNGKFVLWPGSGLAKKTQLLEPQELADNARPSTQQSKLPQFLQSRPKWVVAAERLETTRKFLRVTAKIDPSWIEPLASHLIQKSYSDPHWNRDTGYVHAFEKVSLFGLVIVPKRRINFGPIDTKQAREIFIQNALVDGELETKCDFFTYNQILCEDAQKLQDKLRRHDLLRGQRAKYDFYQTRIPETVYDKRSLEKWYHNTKKSEKESLFFTLADICVEDVDESVLEKFPDTLTTFDGTDAAIEYNYSPGEEHDGLTVVVPIEGLRQLEPARLGWLVPGLLELKITALLRSLPKEIRKNLVPVPDTAKRIANEMVFAHGVFEEVLTSAASRIAGVRITPKDFQTDKVPDELKMNIRVVSSEGEQVAQGREIDSLRKKLGVKAAESVAAVDDTRFSKEKLTEWNFGDFPESVEITRGKMQIKAFPTLFDRNEYVDLKLSDSLDRANRETRLGLMRLFYLSRRKELKTQVEWLPNLDKMKIYAQPLLPQEPNVPQSVLFVKSISELIALRALEADEKQLPRNELEFKARITAAKNRLGIAVQEVTKFVGPFFESFQQARLVIEQNKKPGTEFAWRDAKSALAELVTPGFLARTEWKWLKEFPRYMKAVSARFERLKSGGEQQDRAATTEIAKFWARYTDRLELHEASGIIDPQLSVFRFMLEEYRVSLFAQKLGTAMKVSAQRLEKQWENVRE
ncbi:MAG: ATP-dependent RNA helicase HrpA [Thermoguttaceae bacterium]